MLSQTMNPDTGISNTPTFIIIKDSALTKNRSYHCQSKSDRLAASVITNIYEIKTGKFPGATLETMEA